MGLLWSQCVTTRLFVSRFALSAAEEAAGPAAAFFPGEDGAAAREARYCGRKLEVVFAPNLDGGRGRAQRYRVALDGVWGVPAERQQGLPPIDPTPPGGGADPASSRQQWEGVAQQAAPYPGTGAGASGRGRGVQEQPGVGHSSAAGGGTAREHGAASGYGGGGEQWRTPP